MTGSSWPIAFIDAASSDTSPTSPRAFGPDSIWATGMRRNTPSSAVTVAIYATAPNSSGPHQQSAVSECSAPTSAPRWMTNGR